MLSKVQKWGNSLAIRIPRPFAEEIGLDRNAEVEVSVSEGRIVVEPVVGRKIRLAALLSDIDDTNLHAEVRTGPAQGNEAF